MKIPRFAILLLIPLTLAGCASTAIQKAQSAVSTVSTDAAKLQTDAPKAEAAVAAVTGSTSDVSNAASYAETIATDAQTLAPLLSELISFIPTTGKIEFTPRGLMELRRFHISAHDPQAVAKLSRALRANRLLSGNRPAQKLSPSFASLDFSAVKPVRVGL